MWRAYPPYVYPGKALAERWVQGETEQVKAEINQMILPARYIIVGAVLAELHMMNEPQCERFVTIVVNSILLECMTCEHQRCRGPSGNG